ncbi:hypothetical protein F7018_04855 [Tenacibaculum aiptasiae]|uniref:Uncharacterized protein n=1 Tax=Tenacibaculum aiptasiae TaxID=426481 RepID=A0A7J5AQ55_9FLAO|nr:hypothetical protein [Tenacibaculum aiptasiae]KAB1159642.1 hypothetical protein F7018_04855 [Tenacibaculum aiptasiae]
MDLDKYKKAWDNQPEETDRVSKVDIYKMAHSKSSSIVKWIFIIGILELLFWSGLNIFFIESSYTEVYEQLHLKSFVKVSIYLHYFVIVVFLYFFYKNYKSISISDTTKVLLQKILKTRKTVKYYVYFNLLYVVFANIFLLCFVFSDLDLLIDYYNSQGIATPDNKQHLLISLIIATVFLLGFMVLILWLFYRIIYGVLLRKLNKNYKELSKLEDLN